MENNNARKIRVVEMPPAGPGNHYENIAPLGEPPNWQIRPGEIESNRDETLFGYAVAHFMAKQYKTQRR
jgi:hypothetical protein